MKATRKIVYTAGGFQVWEVEKLACKACRAGWADGTRIGPKEGGEPCMHGRGRWQVGFTGPRGGWRGVSDFYRSEYAAMIVCDALARAAAMAPDGVD